MRVFLICAAIVSVTFPLGRPGESPHVAMSDHQKAEEDFLIDACPRIKKPLDPLKYKLLPTLIDGQMEMCCGCDDGELNVGPCTPGKPETTRCVPCPDRTYNAELAHNKTQCKRHVLNMVCPPDRILVDGGKTEQHRCDCREGSFLHNGKCRPHIPCPDHYGVKIRGNFERDTVCEKCRVGYDSPDVSATVICTLISYRTTRTSDVTEPPRTITSHRSPPPSSENLKSEPDNNGGVALIPVIFIVIFFAVIVVLLCCYKRILPKRFRNFLPRNNRSEGVEAKENEAGQLLDSNDAVNKGSRNISIASFSNVDEDKDVKRSDLQQKPSSVKGSSKLENVKDYEVVECHSLQFSAPVAEDGLVKARPTSAGPSASSLSGHRASYSLTFSNQFTRKMRDLGNDLSEAFSPQDINIFFRKFSKAKYPENVIHYIELGPDRPRPSEKFIKLFNELMKHGEDHFNPKLIHGCFEKKDWMTYALVVEEKFPELRIASYKNSPHYSRADVSQS